MAPWIILAVLVSFAAGLLSGTLLRRRQSAADGAVISSNQSPTIGGEDRVFAWSGGGITAAAVIAGFAVLSLVGLYASVEAPEPRSGPSSTSTEGSAAVERLAALSRDQFSQAAPSPAERPLPSVDEMIQRLATRLSQNPNDPEGWRMLAWSYFNTQRFIESAAAYSKAIELRPDFAEFRSLRGEALISAANGVVTAEAMQAFDEALARYPAEPKARFFKGLAKAQAGDKTVALEDWISILNEGDSNESWHAELKQRTADLGRELGIDITSRLRNHQAAASGDVLKALSGPQPASPDARAAVTTPPADQSAMIRGMVDGLAARLEQSPRDAEGWIKLMRSRMVLGETDRAKDALDRALTVFDNTSQERSLITAAARELGILR